MSLIQINNRTLFYRTGKKELNPEWPNLFWIHGAGGSHQNWLNQLVGNHGPVNVLALDLPGHGESEGPGEETISGYADWVLAFLKECPGTKWILGGHSMGGAIAIECALKDPAAMDALILAGTGARLPVDLRFLKGLQEDPNTWIERVIQFAYAPEAPRELVSGGVALMKAAPAGVVWGDFTACNGFDRSETLKEIQKPVLIICGAKDILAPPAASLFLKEQIPGASYQSIPEAGHMAMLEKPELFDQAVEDFLNHLL